MSELANTILVILRRKWRSDPEWQAPSLAKLDRLPLADSSFPEFKKRAIWRAGSTIYQRPASVFSFLQQELEYWDYYVRYFNHLVEHDSKKSALLERDMSLGKFVYVDEDMNKVTLIQARASVAPPVSTDDEDVLNSSVEQDQDMNMVVSEVEDETGTDEAAAEESPYSPHSSSSSRSKSSEVEEDRYVSSTKELQSLDLETSSSEKEEFGEEGDEQEDHRYAVTAMTVPDDVDQPEMGSGGLAVKSSQQINRVGSKRKGYDLVELRGQLTTAVHDVRTLAREMKQVVTRAHELKQLLEQKVEKLSDCLEAKSANLVASSDQLLARIQEFLV